MLRYGSTKNKQMDKEEQKVKAGFTRATTAPNALKNMGTIVGKDSGESAKLAGKQLNRLTGGVSNKVSSGVKAGIKKLKDKFKF
jgi:hypothetical protein